MPRGRTPFRPRPLLPRQLPASMPPLPPPRSLPLMAGVVLLLLVLSAYAGHATGSSAGPDLPRAASGTHAFVPSISSFPGTAALSSARPLPAASRPHALLPNVTATQPLTGWSAPRGPVDLNGTAPGYGPERNLTTGAPPLFAQASLGPHALSSLGFVIAPGGGPVVVALTNSTICAWNSTTLLEAWCRPTAQPLSTAPIVVGDEAVAVANATAYAWNLSNGAPPWHTLLGSFSMGAAPTFVGGSLFVLTSSSVVVLNASTGTRLATDPTGGVDPRTPLAYANGTLYGQADTGASTVLGFSLFGQQVATIPDAVPTGGSTLVSDGLLAVAGAGGQANGGISGTTGWYDPSLGAGKPLAPLAATGDLVLATNGSGPLAAFEARHGAELWQTPSWVSSSPSVAGSSAFVDVNASVEGLDLSSPSGSLLWTQPLPGKATLAPEVAGGLLYVLDGSGNLSAFGFTPLAVHATLSRVLAAAFSPVNFTAFVDGGAGGPSSVSWTFSDGFTSPESQLTHAFASSGPAWAQAVAVDAQGVETLAAEVSLTLLPQLTVTLNLSTTDGQSPLTVDATAIPRGGNLSWTAISFQVQGVGAGWYSTDPATSIYGTTLRFAPTFPEASDLAIVTAWVNDTAGDVSTSQPQSVTIGPAQYPPLSLQAVPTGPGTLLVGWRAPSIAGFEDWYLNVSVAGGSFENVAVLPSESTSFYNLTDLPMDAPVSVVVTGVSEYGPWGPQGAVTVQTPLYAPVLTATPAPGLPGQALLAWGFPSRATVYDFEEWVLWTTLPGATSPSRTILPSYVGASNVSYTTGPLEDLNSTTFALEVETVNHLSANSTPVAFTPGFAPPALTVSVADLKVSVLWSSEASLPEFLEVVVCYEPTVLLQEVVCPLRSDEPAPSAVLSFQLPAGGSYVVNATVVAANGFVVQTAGSGVTGVAPSPSPAWYAVTLEGMALWTWALLLLLLALVVFLGVVVFRDRRDIPPYHDEVMPWDPLQPDVEPHAKPSSPETLSSEPRLHRHRDSHTHRHLRVHREEEDVEEAPSPKGSPGGAASAPSVRRPAPREAAAPAGKATAAPAKEAGADSEEPALRPPRARPSKAAPVSIDQVGEERLDQVGDQDAAPEEAAPSGEPSSEEMGELKKLPVVLRHKDAPPAPEPDVRPSHLKPARKLPPPDRATKGSQGAEDEGDDDEEEATAPKRPPPRAKPENPDDPTL